jgi:peptide/nickel transport system permease protein
MAHHRRTTPRRRPGLGRSLAVAATLALLLGIAPSIAPLDPFTQQLDEELRPPSRLHPCGQDKLGRDVLGRVVYGARISLGVGLSVVALAVVIGLVLGTLAGISGGRVDRTIMGLVDVLLAFPGLLLAIALVAVLGPSVRNVVLSLALLGWTGYARLIRGEILRLRAREFVMAAHALGANPGRIATHHLIPGVVGVLGVQATFGVAGAIIAEGSLSFLGLGVPAPLPSWGAMLADARPYLLIAPHLTLFPALAVMLTVLAVNLLGDRLRDHLDVFHQGHLGAESRGSSSEG